MTDGNITICEQQFTDDLCFSRDQAGKPRIYTTRNGTQYPSITSILSATMSAEKAEILAKWKKRVGDEEAERIRIESTTRGEALHYMVENYIVGNEVKNKSNLPVVDRLFKQIKPVIKRINNVRMIEKSLYSTGLKIAGRVDLIAEFDGKLSIIDFKTSTKVKTEEMIGDYFIQETFYAVAYAEHFREKVEQIVTIIATENSLKPYIFIEKPINFLQQLKQRARQYHAHTNSK
jgi:ATP-dependent exoDNAse (exonuclease V) beta subunit